VRDQITHGKIGVAEFRNPTCKCSGRFAFRAGCGLFQPWPSCDLPPTFIFCSPSIQHLITPFKADGCQEGQGWRKGRHFPASTLRRGPSGSLLGMKRIEP